MTTTVATPPFGRTIFVLGLLFLVDVWLMGNMGGGVLSTLVGMCGCAVFLVAALRARVGGTSALARNRALRAGLYLLLAVAAVGVMRYRARAFDAFHQRLTAGMSVLEVLQEADAVYARHPTRWSHISVWGTRHDFGLPDATAAARAPDNIAGVTWYANTPRSARDLESAANTLAPARQIWFTFRTGVGYLHFFVTLKAGRVESVSEVTGHQA
jgi:hypothetical protein